MRARDGRNDADSGDTDCAEQPITSALMYPRVAAEERSGLCTLVFGGWVEELIGMVSPRPIKTSTFLLLDPRRAAAGQFPTRRALSEAYDRV